jgi:pimeloyl-ACP methyl ester carboxylesterase
MEVTRRALIGGAIGAGALALSACSGANLTTESGTITSRHWPGRKVNWRFAIQREGDSDARPTVVVLHGKGGNADAAFDLGLQDHLNDNRLSLASIDGGNLYWHRRRNGDDPGAVVVDDLLPMLPRRNGNAGKIALLGWSMGGYGALLLASELGPERVAAVVAESAALWTAPGSSAPGAFDDREDFEAHDVFAPKRLAVLSRIPVRLDCGRDDPFAAANRAFGRALPSAELTIDAGAHTTGYWRDHASAQLAWVRRQYGS